MNFPSYTYILHSDLKCSFGRVLNTTGNRVRRCIPGKLYYILQAVSQHYLGLGKWT